MISPTNQPTPAETLCRVIKPTIVEQFDSPPRAERLVDLPAAYAAGATGDWFSTTLGSSQVWHHQGLALEKIAAGAHVVLATSTASGKTLPFIAAAIHELLTGRGTIMVLYPQKALSGDQLVRWRQAAAVAGLPEELIAEINGFVPTCEREGLMQGARIILATHDIVHSWLLRNHASPVIRPYLRRLRFLVLDEAHALEGVFGTNCAYLFLRLRSIVERIKSMDADPVRPLQMIAATATIADPVKHMFKLTGCHFELVGEADNGAPAHRIKLMHIEGPANGPAADKMLADLVSSLASEAAPAALIAFADTRQGVERVAKMVGSDEVLPYRSGYDRDDRRNIEQALRRGDLRAVISTSALELGIDVPQFRYGFNRGVPMSLKAARQRVGRVGRTSEGVFAFVAPSQAFARYGSSFSEFYNGEIEPCHLYLNNGLIQYQHACCLREECEMIDGKVELPDNVEWPVGFAEAFALAAPGAPKPRDIERIAMVGGGAPHLDYPLRHIAEPEYALRLARTGGDPIGCITKDKAMREAHPGAVYMHMRRAYRVLGWKTTGYENTITLQPIKGSEQTKPMFDTIVNVSHDPLDIIDSNVLHGTSGSIAETCMRVVESVYGYTVGGKPLPYRELSKTDPRMTSKHREFGTTGVVIRISEPWFKGPSEHQMAARRTVAKAFAEMLIRELSISAADVSWAHTGISIYAGGRPSKLDDAIVIFDNVQGGLRLTAPLYTRLSGWLERLAKAVKIAGPEAMLSESTVARLLEWQETLTDQRIYTPAEVVHGEDERVIYAEGSVVRVRFGNSLEERRLLAHQLVSIGDTSQLMYRYESAPGVTAWVPHELIEPVGDGWQHVIWNQRTNSIREIAA